VQNTNELFRPLLMLPERAKVAGKDLRRNTNELFRPLLMLPERAKVAGKDLRRCLCYGQLVDVFSFQPQKYFQFIKHL